MQKTKKKKRASSTQSLIPIKAIRDGIIITEDNRYLKVIEIFPTNFNLKAIDEKNAIARTFRQVFRAGPPNMQFKIISRRADMRNQLNALKEDMSIDREESDKCFELQLDYARLLIDASETESVTRRFFIVFEYEYASGLLYKPEWPAIVDQMETTAMRIAGSLRSCGNEITYVDDPTEQSMEIFYSILNARKSSRMPYEKRHDEIMLKYLDNMDTSGDGPDMLPSIPFKEFIAPKNISFVHDNYIISDGLYQTYAYIPGNGYNNYVAPGWMSVFVNAGIGIDTDIFFNRVPKEQVSYKLRQSITTNRAAMINANESQSNYDTIAETINSSLYIKRALSSGQDFYYMSTLLTISAESHEGLEWKFTELKKMLRTLDVEIKRCRFQMPDAFKASLLSCGMSKSLWEKSKRNIMTNGASAAYPFTSFELCDDNGILLGRNTSNGSLAILNIFNTKKYQNANIFIAGATGAGKTYTLLLLAIRMRIKHVPVMIISPTKEQEFRRVCEAIDGQFIKLGSGSPHRINVMEIFKVDEEATRAIDGDDIVVSRLEEKVQNLKVFIAMFIPDITYEEKEILDEALLKTYAKKGITRDNESLYDPEDKTHTRYREMPILGDLYETLLEMEGTGRICIMLKTLVTGSSSFFNGQTNVDLRNDFIVLGLDNLVDDILPMGMYMAIDYIWSRIKEDRTEKKAMFIDEWWKFAFNPVAADYSLKIAKTIRAYGGSMVLATQDLDDIFAIENGKYGKGVINNCRTKILMHMESTSKKITKELFGLTDSEWETVVQLQIGNAMLMVNGSNVCIRFDSSEMENDLITTDREELRAMVEDGKAKKAAEKHNRQEEIEKIFDLPELEVLELIE